jgi:hypothetical protein
MARLRAGAFLVFGIQNSRFWILDFGLPELLFQSKIQNLKSKILFLWQPESHLCRYHFSDFNASSRFDWKDDFRCRAIGSCQLNAYLIRGERLDQRAWTE